jgi:hypothetical protein
MKNVASRSDSRATFSTSDQSNPQTCIVSEAVPPAQANILSSPITVDRFWRNRRGEAVVTQLKEYEGRALVDLRVFYTDQNGKLAPTTKGLAVKMSKLPDLVRAVNRAHAEAKRLGLLGVPVHGGAQ